MTSNMRLLYILHVVFILAKSAFSEMFNDLGTSSNDMEVGKEEVAEVTQPSAGPEPWEYPRSEEIKHHYLPDLKHPHTLTRLIKTLSEGLHPQFLQQEPLMAVEKRRKPVTLIGMRRHGVFPHENVNLVNSQDTDVAELMSPYNDIGHFWDEDSH